MVNKVIYQMVNKGICGLVPGPQPLLNLGQNSQSGKGSQTGSLLSTCLQGTESPALQMSIHSRCSAIAVAASCLQLLPCSP